MSDTATTGRGVRFTGRSSFLADMRGRITAKIDNEGLLLSGYLALWVKGLLMLGWLIASVYTMWFVADNWWQLLLCMVSTALAMVGVAFNIGHDFIHGAGISSKVLRRSRSARFFNWLGRASFDMIGASSYVWKYKHGDAHHSYTNVSGADSDIDQAPFVRLDPEQKYRPWYRVQHWYAWFMYGALVPKWHLAGDFINIQQGRIGQTPVPKPKRGDLALLIGGKLFSSSWMFLLPWAAGASWLTIIVAYLGIGFMAGVLLAVVFQLAHAVDGAAFVKPDDDGSIESAWAEHQVESTRDFYYAGPVLNRPINWLLNFYLGGLDYQTIHHLFPRVPHTIYRQIQPEFAAICAEHGVEYVRQPVGRALFLHGRWLRKMGNPPRSASVGV